MTPIEAVRASARPILEIGRAWMMAPSTATTAAELGLAELGRFGFWVNGRAGVLGDVDRHIATAAIGFMAPAAVAEYWSGRPSGLSAWSAALAWFDCGAVWARQAWSSLDEADLRRLSDLARKVIDRADLSIGALFAGSTLIPLPGDPAGDAAINLNVLRELRGGAHLAACHAAGLGPHATIMSTDDPVRGGAAWAEGFGWSAPHSEPDPAARSLVEELTDKAMVGPLGSLSPDERVEFVKLVAQAHSVL